MHEMLPMLIIAFIISLCVNNAILYPAYYPCGYRMFSSRTYILMDTSRVINAASSTRPNILSIGGLLLWFLCHLYQRSQAEGYITHALSKLCYVYLAVSALVYLLVFQAQSLRQSKRCAIIIMVKRRNSMLIGSTPSYRTRSECVVTELFSLGKL
jgi:hypothetical protein